MNWIILSFIAMLSFLFMNYIFKIVGQRSMIPLLAIAYIASALILLPFFRPTISKREVLLGIAAGILALIGSITSFLALQKAPNPGFVLAIIATNSLCLALISHFLLGAKLGVDDILGITLVIIGLGLIVI